MLRRDDLFGYREYMQMHDKGYVRENTHPSLDLIIYNYTEKAQYEQEWNNVTAQCRGLIVNSEGYVIARPFDKFMNYGQNPKDPLLMDDRVVVTDKLDGSLGILWNYKGNLGIATRGSFTSDQAIHASALLNIRYAKYNPIREGMTYMFEIIYPENRVVLNYGSADALYLLGARDIETGATFGPTEFPEWRGNRTTTFPYKTLREALEAPTRFNAEGFVVYFPDQDYRIKIKQEDYIALHKIVTGLTKKRVWENLREGKTLTEMCEIVPDEWHEWLTNTVADLQREFRIIRISVNSDYWQLLKQLNKAYPEGWDRKIFARHASSKEWTEYPGLLFRLLDGRDIDDAIWKMVKPKGEEQ